MDFASYTAWEARTGADLVNTLGSTTGREYLPEADSLKRFLREHRMEAPRSISERDLEEVRKLRARLRAIWETPSERQRSRLLNRLLAEAGTLPQVTDHGGDWHLHYAPMEAPIAQRLAAIAAMGLAVVVSDFGHERLGICNADDCRDVYVDTSRNRSRRYCDESCASRTNVAAFRARQKKRPKTSSGAAS
jgi:predicted RNA-binding Zn ribbon-like protein